MVREVNLSLAKAINSKTKAAKIELSGQSLQAIEFSTWIVLTDFISINLLNKRDQTIQCIQTIYPDIPFTLILQLSQFIIQLNHHQINLIIRITKLQSANVPSSWNSCNFPISPDFTKVPRFTKEHRILDKLQEHITALLFFSFACWLELTS